MPKTRDGRGWRARDIVLTLLVVALVGAVVASRILYTPYRIPSASMIPTLMQGDCVAARNERPPLHVGDIVFFTHISMLDGRPQTYVRRVLALPGQRIAFRDGVPIVDGVTAQQIETDEAGLDDERVMRETLEGKSYRVSYGSDGPPDLRNMPERIVPVGRVFLVGDARDNSLDSRIEGPELISDIKQTGGWIIFSPIPARAGHRIE